MNYEEIEVCVMRARAGSTEDLVKLLHQFKPFIVKTAKQFKIKSYDQADLLQIGYSAIIKAVSKYVLGSSTFNSYVYNTIKNSLPQTARVNPKYSVELSLNCPINPDSEKTSEFVDNIRSDENFEEDIANSLEIKDLRAAVAKLNKDEQELIDMVYYNGVSMKAYACLKNLSYPKVLKKRERILIKLRGILRK
jgi:RNA polymerase sigma factor (sigma-70 family)